MESLEARVGRLESQLSRTRWAAVLVAGVGAACILLGAVQAPDPQDLVRAHTIHIIDKENGKIAAVLGRYSREDLALMLEGGAIRVSCEFCRREYLFDAEGREARG